ncbi:MAG: LysR family transcriptional regulator [Actinomycetota bacterium]|nr:LysR family transcriptional regulator [Actinomycetota bacterium]
MQHFGHVDLLVLAARPESRLVQDKASPHRASNSYPDRIDNCWLSMWSGPDDNRLVDLDSALLRAFVVTAEEMHFGRAAGRLQLTQQALSKRVARLENLLAVRVLDRASRRVELTDAGRRLLPLARQAVDAVDAVDAVVFSAAQPLVVDVLGENLTPMHLLRRALARQPDLDVEIIMRDNKIALAESLRSGGADVAIGWSSAVEEPWPPDIQRRVLLLEPVYVLMSAQHELAGRDEITLAELVDVALWFPTRNAPPEWVRWLDELAAAYGLRIDRTGTTLGFDDFLNLGGVPERVSFFGAAMPAPPGEQVRLVPIVEPTPVVVWSVMWRRRVPDARVARLVQLMTEGQPDLLRATRTDPEALWLPDRDRAYVAGLPT